VVQADTTTTKTTTTTTILLQQQLLNLHFVIHNKPQVGFNVHLVVKFNMLQQQQQLLMQPLFHVLQYY